MPCVGVMVVLLGEESVRVLGSCRTVGIYICDRCQAV